MQYPPLKAVQLQPEYFLFRRLPADFTLANDLTQLKHWRSFAQRQIFAENQ